MSQVAIPCLFMRGGTSRGPFFNSADLPVDRDKLSEMLLDAMGRCGSPQPDGLGGTASVTNKVAMLSMKDGVVQYFFAQVVPEESRVDYSPNCGNMLVAVGPAAIEMGLVEASEPETVVDIVNVNTGVRAQSVVQTPGGRVTYDGDASIGGVALRAAPVLVSFVDPAGAKTSGLLPTGKVREEIDNCAVTLIDSSVPMMWVRAADLGVTIPNGQPLDQDKALMERLEAMRLEAGHRMGMGDCTGKVIPKVGLVAAPGDVGTISARYFTPYSQHPTFAFTGGVCAASLCRVPGTIAAEFVKEQPPGVSDVVIEHASGVLEITIETDVEDCGATRVSKAGSVRTARLIMRGELYVRG